MCCHPRRALGSLGWFRGAPRGLAAPPGRLLPGPGCRGGLPKGRSMRIQGGQSGESLQSAPILSNCAPGAASIGDLLARNSLLPDLRPGADSRGASVRPCQGALAPRLPPRSPPFPQEGGHRGTLKPPPKPRGRGCLKSGVQPIVNLPSPYSFSSVAPPLPAHRAYTLLCPPARERATARSTGPGRGLPSPGTNVACQPERGFQTQSAHGAGGRPGSRRWARWRPGGPGTVSSGHGRNWARWRGVGGWWRGWRSRAPEETTSPQRGPARPIAISKKARVRGRVCACVFSFFPGRKPKRKMGVKVLLKASPETCLQ